MSTGHTPVFFDHSGKRWKRIIRYATIAAFLASITGAIFSFGIFVLPLSPFAPDYRATIHKFIPRIETRQEAVARFKANKAIGSLKKVIAEEKQIKRQARHPRSPGTPYSTTLGFYVGWGSDASYNSLREHADNLTLSLIHI